MMVDLEPLEAIVRSEVMSGFRDLKWGALYKTSHRKTEPELLEGHPLTPNKVTTRLLLSEMW